MISEVAEAVGGLDLGAAQEHFVAVVLPIVERRARCYLRWLRGWEKEDAVADAVGLAWGWYLALARRGRAGGVGEGFAVNMGTLAAQAARGRRSVCGHGSTEDALSPQAHLAHAFALERLPAGLSGEDDLPAGLVAALQDDTSTP